MYKVKLSELAMKFYSGCDKSIANKLTRCFHTLKLDPYKNNNIKKLSMELGNYFRFRTGDYRVVYKVNELLKEVVIRTIDHPSKVYKML